MVKLLPLILMISSGLFLNNPHVPVSSSFEHDNLVLESKENGHYSLVGVTDVNLTEIRIYHDEEFYIDSIKEEAFDSSLALESLMISYTVTTIPSPLFTTPENHPHFQTINYTGSEEQWIDLNYSTSYTVNFDACDEGFIRMWDRIVRPTADSSICDIGKAGYERVIELYETLSEADRAIVDEHPDLEGATIGESIESLRDYFGQTNASYSDNRDISSSTMISFVIVIAVIGMTFIMVFYYLKDKNIIE